MDTERSHKVGRAHEYGNRIVCTFLSGSRVSRPTKLTPRRKPIIQNEHGEKQNLSNYFLCAMRERLLEETVDAQILGGGRDEGVLCMAQLAEECLKLTREERPTMKDVEMRLQLLTGRRVARPAGQEQVAPLPRCGGDVPVIGEHGSRRFSQEQEFVSSLLVPR